MLSAVERVLILRSADLLREVGPRQLLRLAEVAQEVELARDEWVYRPDDPADALYILVEGRVRLETDSRVTSEVGAGEAFGTWALVDDSARGQSARCIEDGLALALRRDEFYEVAAGDLTLLQEVVRALARRLRALVSERPEEARVEAEGAEKPAEAGGAGAPVGGLPPANAGAALEAAVLDRPAPAPDAPAEQQAGSTKRSTPDEDRWSPPPSERL